MIHLKDSYECAAAALDSLVVPQPLPPVLLLDLDDTILDDSGARDECWRVACAEAAEAHPGLDARALQDEIERVRDVFWRDPDRHREWRPRMREAWGRVASEAVAGLGIDDPALGPLLGNRHFELRDAAISPLPGAVEALRHLRSLGVTLGLVTNGGSEGQRAEDRTVRSGRTLRLHRDRGRGRLWQAAPRCLRGHATRPLRHS